MSSKTFDGSVSIVKNTKGEIALKKDTEGKFNASNADECYSTLKALAKTHKATVNKYSLFMVEGGTEAVLLSNRYGNPYLAILPKQAAADGSTRKVSVTKLA